MKIKNLFKIVLVNSVIAITVNAHAQYDECGSRAAYEEAVSFLSNDGGDLFGMYPANSTWGNVRGEMVHLAVGNRMNAIKAYVRKLEQGEGVDVSDLCPSEYED